MNEVDYSSRVGISLYRKFSVEHFLPSEAKKKKLVFLRYVTKTRCIIIVTRKEFLYDYDFMLVYFWFRYRLEGSYSIIHI